MKRSMVVLLRDVCDEWLEVAKKSQLNAFGLHFIVSENDVQSYIDWLEGEGRAFVQAMEAQGVTIEHELHAVNHLLPRSLFETHPEYFRMNKEGVRTNDYNLCPHSEEALALVADNAYVLATQLKQSGHQYYLWLDDKVDVACACEKCKKITAADQNLLIIQAILQGLRRYDPKAQICYLAYADVMEPPTLPVPDGIFLEFAPYFRKPDKAMTDPENTQWREVFDRLLKVFPAETTEILEYWIDLSLISDYKRANITRLPYHEELFTKDFDYYVSKGVSGIKTFAAYVDQDYLKTYGGDELEKFGCLLKARTEK